MAPGDHLSLIPPVLDAFQSAYRYVPVRVRHRHPPLFRRMFELLVAPDLIHLIPAVFLSNAFMTSRLALRTFFHVLRLCRGKRAGVHSNDQQSDQDCADQHDDPYIEAGVKGLVASGGSEQA